MSYLERSVIVTLCVCGAVPAFAGSPPIVLPGPGSAYTTPAASAELAAICPTGTGYPAEWGWLGRAQTSPVAATSGTPRIDQVRNGQVIASYTTFANGPNCHLVGDGTDYLNPGPAAASGCGPFTREYTFRLWQSGDVFLVYPAVYTGDLNEPWIGPAYDSYAAYAAGQPPTPPDGVTIQGVVQNNTRPVILLVGASSNNTLGQAPLYFDQSNGFTMDSIDVIAGANAGTGKAGVYEQGGSNLTLSNMRISGFARAGVNGLFGAGGYSGTLTLKSMEFDHNGGQNGPAHNVYISASLNDPNFTVDMQHSWSHHAYYGHLFKTRAQVNVFTANFFQGSLPWGNYTQSENYLLDVPNGGMLTARDNVFVKNMSGYNSNGMSVTFAMEGIVDARPQSIDLENNSFITFAKTFDGFHQTYPLSFFFPNMQPTDANWPASIPARVIKNAFVGYCPAGGGPQDYRGDIDLTEAFSEVSRAYTFSTKVEIDDSVLSAIYPAYLPIVGTPAYTQQLQTPLTRAALTLGAQD